MTVIDQQLSGCWEFNGKGGRSIIERGTVVAGLQGLNFACRHSDVPRPEHSNILGLRAEALADCDEPLFDQQVLRGLTLPDLGRSLSLETTDEFESFVFEVFHHVSRASLGKGDHCRPNLRAQRMKRFIEQHAFEDISLADIAACTGLSPFRCIRQFKMATGITPLMYLHLLRLERARKLLSSTRLTIGEIATRVAIRDRFYFTRWFSKHTGISPQAFRDCANR